jgi:pimeloyl-ACP methyl ester carboxylesterase
MKVIFSHGKESGPWGSKIKRLANTAEQYGCKVESIDYSDIFDPDLRVVRLVNVLKEIKEGFMLVGSSMGGYVSLVASEKVAAKGLFLLAPALYMTGYNEQNFNSDAYVEIVHGWSDDIVPPENSIRFAKSNNSSLHLIAGDHRLNSSMEVVERLFHQFLESQGLKQNCSG